MPDPIKIIDLFAGPGGLGEGFSNCMEDSPFEIAMSVEFEKKAHSTLTHRAFYRKLDARGKKRFLDYVRTTNQTSRSQILEALKTAYVDEWEMANHETMGEPHTLGNSKVWEKLKEGLIITDEDRKDTPQQIAISKRVKEIKKECKKNKVPLIVIGGPPCQSYSISGRSRAKGIEGYSPDEDQRFFLYREYCRVLSEATPDIFIMENVKGILSAKLANEHHIFPMILDALREPCSVLDKKSNLRYRLYSIVKQPDQDESTPSYRNFMDFNIKADQFGVPQSRNRVIVLGVREDHGRITNFMQSEIDLSGGKTNGAVSISDLIGSFPPLRSGISKREKEESDTFENWLNQWNESKKILMGNLTSPEFRSTRDVLQKQQQAPMSSKLNTGNEFFVESSRSGFSRTFEKSTLPEHVALRKWLYHPNLSGFANHSTKSHQRFDRKIYMFVAAYAIAHSDEENPSPTSKHFPRFLAPDHKSWHKGDHADRFRCFESSKTPKTITSHLKKDGHAFIHYDIKQNRAISPREAARIQTFPDDYFFEGKQGSQYQQVGNAVPPFLARLIALHVLEILKGKKLLN